MSSFVPFRQILFFAVHGFDQGRTCNSVKENRSLHRYQQAVAQVKKKLDTTFRGFVTAMGQYQGCVGQFRGCVGQFQPDLGQKSPVVGQFAKYLPSRLQRIIVWPAMQSRMV